MTNGVYIFYIRRLGTYRIAHLHWCAETDSSWLTTANGVCLFPTLYSLMSFFYFVLFVSSKPIVKHLPAHYCITSNQSLPGFHSRALHISMHCFLFHTEMFNFHFLRWKTPNYLLKPFLCVSSPVNSSPILNRKTHNLYQHPSHHILCILSTFFLSLSLSDLFPWKDKTVFFSWWYILKWMFPSKAIVVTHYGWNKRGYWTEAE